jgi:hypothetical protein
MPLQFPAARTARFPWKSGRRRRSALGLGQRMLIPLLVFFSACEAGDLQPGTTPLRLLGGPAVHLDSLTLTLSVAVEDEFGAVADVAVSSIGRVFVADYLALTVNVYDSVGTAIGSIGRQGDGPGEFRALTSVDVKGDSLFVLDAALRRVSLFHPVPVAGEDSFELLGTISLADEVGRRPSAMSVDSNRNLVVQWTPFAGGEQRPTILVKRYALSGAALPARVVEVPGVRWLTSDGAVEWAPFEPRVQIHLGPGDTIWTVDGASGVVRSFPPSGDPGRSFDLGVESRLVSLRDIENLVATTESPESPESRATLQRWRKALNDGRLREEIPRVHQWVIDEDGRFWLQSYHADDRVERAPIGGFRYLPGAEPGFRLWSVNPSGEVLGWGRVDSRTRLVGSAGGKLLTVVEAATGEETIKILDLPRNFVGGRKDLDEGSL